MKRLFLVIAIVVFLITLNIFAQIPQTMNYQGVLTDTDGTIVADDNYNLTFKLYAESSGGTALWEESQTVQITSGIFNAILGSIIPLNLPFNQKYYLGISVEGGDELTPRIELTASAYSLKARSVADSSIASANVQNGQLVRSINDLKDNVKIAGGNNITINQDGDSLIVSATGLAGGDITSVAAGMGLTGGGESGDVALIVLGGTGLSVGDSVRLNVPYTDGRYVNEAQANSVTSAMITDGVVGNADLASNAVTEVKIANNTVTAAKINPNIVSSVEGVINDGGNIDLIGGSNITITSDDGANTITIAATGVGTGDITSVNAGDGLTGGGTTGDVTLDVEAGTGISVDVNSISLDEVYTDGRYINEAQANSVTSAMIQDGTVDSDDITNNSIISLDLADNAVTSAKIQASQITNAHIVDNAVTANKISPNIISSIDGVINDGGDINFVAGSNITINPDDAANTITISAAAQAGNTLDLAYDQGSAGAGRTIIADAGAFEVNGVDGALFTGTYGSGTIPSTGAGVRMMWYPRKAAFRAGNVTGTQWDDSNIGFYSNSMGYNTTASGNYSLALGYNSTASSLYSTAMGWTTTASGGYSTAMGRSTTASGSNSTSMGGYSNANGDNSLASGSYVTTNGDNSVAMGISCSANGYASVSLGATAVADASYSRSFGFQTIASATHATAIGVQTIASGTYSTAIGQEIEAQGTNTIAISLSDLDGLQVTQDNTMAIMGGKVGINEIAPTAELQVGGVDGVLFTGTYGSGTLPVTGLGTRMMWYPAKAAFRAGYVNGTQWDDANIGNYSIALGYGTTASNSYSTAMGAASTASGHASTAMGRSADATGTASVALGDYTEASGSASTAMGRSTTANGGYSTAMGSYMGISGTGSFAIGDYSVTVAPMFTTNNRFYARFANGFRLYTNSGYSAGVYMDAGDNSWRTMSDSTKKENFKAVDGEEFLGKISKFNLTSWNYKGQDPSQFRHYGPMAQDFYAAFGNDGVGTIGNDTTLSSADFDGINFIAIQALEKRTAEIKNLRNELQLVKQENREMKKKMNDLVSLVNQLKTQFVVLKDKINADNTSQVQLTDNR